MSLHNYFRSIIFLVIIASLSSLALSEEFSGYKYPYELFKLNGDNFTLKTDKTFATLVVTFNDETMLIKNSTCKNTASNLYRICFNGTFINLSSNPQIGKFSETTNDLVPGILLKITYNKPDIKLKRTFSDINPDLFEEIYANITIENNGKNPADIIYIEKIPENFQIIQSNGFEMYKNELILKSRINALSSQIFTYSIRPINYSISEIQGNLTYSFENINGKLLTDKTTITPIQIIKIIITNQETLDIDEESVLYYNLSNIYKNEVELNLSILLSNKIEVTDAKKEFKKTSTNQSDMYTLNLKLKPQESIKKELKIKPLFTGNHNINSKIEYKINEIKTIFEKNFIIKTTASKIEPTIQISNNILSSNEKFNIQIRIKNNDTKNTFQNINSAVTSELFSNQFITSNIMTNNEIILFEQEFRASIINESKIIYFNFSGTYETKNLEKFNFSQIKTINISPIQNIVYTVYEIENKSNHTVNLTIVVFVENKKGKEIKINSKDEFSDESKFISGEKETLIVLPEYSKKKIYSYIISSENANKTYETIVNTINYTEGDTEFLIKKEIIINLNNRTLQTKSPKLIYQQSSINSSDVSAIKNNTNNYSDNKTIANDSKIISINESKKNNDSKKIEKIAPKKDSIFTKIKNFFKNLF